MQKPTRRGHQEGSIYQRGDGRWTSVVDCGWKNGRRVRKSFYGDTRKAVQEKLTKALRDQQLGLPIASGKQRVGEFLTAWLEGTAKPRLRPGTFADYSKIVGKHLVPQLGRIVLLKLEPEHVRALLRAKTAEGLSARRVKVIRAVLHTALREACDWGYVARNVADYAKAPRAVRYQATVLDPQQARQMLQVASEHRLGAVFSVGLAIGLRLGEALGLRWQDLDLVNGKVTICQALQRVEKRLHFVEPKSESSRRTVQLPTMLGQILKRHRTRQQEERLRAGAKWQESGLVFTSTIGTALDDRNVRRAFHKVLETAALPKMRIHDLRHTCATLLLAQAVHPKAVQEILGHSQIALTMDTYSTVLQSVSRAAADQMDVILRA